ncbi:MAG TPA: LysE family translocator, partial [Caulobacteraceae bacterium]|nr:LysE family translocator [Caulobacteraceae bacterium]
MTVETALLAYFVAATLLAITPGLDTAMVLRTALAEGPRRAAMAAMGIGCGCLAWGLGVALGLGALLAASKAAYAMLRWAGAAYLCWLGANLILRPRSRFELGVPPTGGGNWWERGLATNLLNPKVGAFYVSFLPQFVPANVPAAPFIMLLASIHVALGLIWSTCLILAAHPAKRWLQRRAVLRWLDRATGT